MPDCSINGNHDAAIALPKDIWSQLWALYVKSSNQSREAPPLPHVYQVPVEIRVKPGKGRGVFLLESVRKGALVTMPGEVQLT